MSFQPNGWTSESTNKEENSSSGWNRASGWPTTSSGWASSDTSGWSKTSSDWGSSDTSGWSKTSSGWGSSNTSGTSPAASGWGQPTGWNTGSNSSGWGLATSSSGWDTNSVSQSTGLSNATGESVSSLSTSKEQPGWTSTFNCSVKMINIQFNFGTGTTFTSFTDPSKSFETSENTSGFVLPTPPSKTAKTKKSFDLSNKPDIGNKTGEEDEEIQFNEKAKVFTLVNQGYVENSTAEIHVNYHPDKKRYRIIARLLSNNSILINSPIIKEMIPQLQSKSVRFVVPLESNEQKPIIRLLQFATEDIAQRFCNLLKDIISKL